MRADRRIKGSDRQDEKRAKNPVLYQVYIAHKTDWKLNKKHDKEAPLH